ncbi:hypothetical protein DW182_18435 [Bacteroides sp. AM16-24]|uniref:Uncharacterized protein n=1 Tax=Bacteroides intestinalis TaxID=329854 RepID=A0A412P6P6_9BACE|nr:hypothetical protein DWX27_15570 [Bacteroides intestinalis]RHI02874.1 hypothetical protein DW182_18435 [Bacteroides sp. AM16-24]RGX86219.1 hypothetical protein DXA61_06160 [Bacteroides intestinalis]RHE81992.1 hypothetical protein DW715_10010 [Bacteroides intestinalis]RHL93133.1 hypothetical protein DWZ95_11230 [Bacteroides intestinalis]
MIFAFNCSILLSYSEFTGRFIFPVYHLSLSILETYLLHIKTVFSPCRGTPEWEMYGASMSQILFIL